MRLIDADALDMAFTVLRFNDDKTLKHWGDRQDWCMSGQEVEDLINSAPTIEERKTGEWITNLYAYGEDRYECDQCHNTALHCYDFCPNCGADMRGEQDVLN